ncbi:protein of unknown function [Cupriavidus taiwanensis]|uniref:Uncharacterized protein n=1 Tax=Cupriavidus taiwanensis TaxID=164546 RepID=A0A375IDT7_9BURK|nr:protein of unknown function [Cupriavidus taiwanensis]
MEHLALNGQTTVRLPGRARTVWKY